MTTKIYEATRAHHFIQKLKLHLKHLEVVTHNADAKGMEFKEAVNEIEKSVNNIITELAKEQQDE